jgi:hypothetical protein
MNNSRGNDVEAHSRYRPSRFFKDGGRWYFQTREGSTEGPFELRVEAEDRLQNYIQVLNSGFYDTENTLTLAPIEQ